MADHQEMIHAAAEPAAMYNSTTTAGSNGGDWWSTVVPPPLSSGSLELPGLSAWSAGARPGSHADVVDGNRSRSNNRASLESPGSNSLAAGSSITFQEPTGVADQSTTACWNRPFLHDLRDGSGFQSYMRSRSDQPHISAASLMSPSSSSNSMMLQDNHDQNYQFLSNLGFELLSSPAASYAGSRSSLLRSLTEPAASAAMSNSPGFMSQAHAPSMNSNMPFWNPSTGFAAPEPPRQAQPRAPVSLVAKNALEGVGDSTTIMSSKATTDPTPLKKARTGTPLPLPTFKVRKEKLGDRVTALQQLVSPFGKTDTASVLHETIEYIKFLHEQVGAHSAPYLKNRQQIPHLKCSSDKSSSDEAAAKRDLMSRGLCLVPISSTFAVANTPVDFWNPFGAAFR